MRRLILGTAGHIDHGKTELVRALTGVDTDRLKEEKERGITIDLGFAELQAADDLRLGVVDVPGHEGFIRNMLAGATGMDLVLLVVAADEGVMPQTREHVSIVSLLGVERIVVTLTKVDLVDEEWLTLVTEEVRALLAETPYREAPIVPTSARTGAGLGELVDTLRQVAEQLGGEDPDDLARLPVDRVFTVRGTGTVVTGTLWSGKLRVGDRVRVLPGELSARIRGLQVHGRDVEEARSGERTAAALTGQGLDKEALARGHVVVSGSGWGESSLLTARVRVLPDVEWALERGQRVRVHLGTAERMARLVLLDGDALLPAEQGWAQLRLEAPALARARERFVIRSYSPVTTIAGGVVAEPLAPKRTRLSDDERTFMSALIEGGVEQAVVARARLAGWGGEDVARLPVTTGLAAERITLEVARCAEIAEPSQASARAQAPRRLGDKLLSAEVLSAGEHKIEEAVRSYHAREPLRVGVDVETLRNALPEDAADGLADALLSRAIARGRLVLEQGSVRAPDFQVRLSATQQAKLESLADVYRSAGLAPPAVSELPAALREGPELWPLLRILESSARVTRLDAELFIWADALSGAADAVRRSLAGRSSLGPADFKDALPITRKHLLPILVYFDQAGVTIRRGNGRDVPGA